MKTKWVVLLTALATCMMFTLFAYCTKDGEGPEGDGAPLTETTVVLSGTSWKTSFPLGEVEVVIFADFTSTSAGNYRYMYIGGDYNGTEHFEYSLNGIHGAIKNNMDFHQSLGGIIPNKAVIDVIDENTIGIGGRVFTKQ